MLKQRLTDELSELRSQIMHLQSRELQLQDQLLVTEAEIQANPNHRPGWPIRRISDQGAVH
ncbi:MAG: hypothetical protein U0934_03435 [Pseudotabrizicola sp.]|uniref:hypothetical protein n=1 Tax=Pseudotabrizicola sp. TaxID=2939647 RepID=UPI0027200D17|nr:hypothetical protein [Pseudotabrizicola sp.]MDO8884396.1 hypothetical protein [Pseudotabrizicola sp.]MDP2081482.1 hypothetical protein [Pseudotabrizicola sp.]MDZ7572995.1 hypothetical protein [Pseudotabrizicola sp.]